MSTPDGFKTLVEVAAKADETAIQRALDALSGKSAQLPSSLEPYLSVRELAGLLRVNPSTIWRWQVPGHLFGGCRRYRLSEVVKHMQNDELKQRPQGAESEVRERNA